MNRLFAWVAALACVAPFAARAAAVPYDLVELATPHAQFWDDTQQLGTLAAREVVNVALARLLTC